MFQSPSLRGSGRFWVVFWLLSSSFQRFNPLHCGAVVASHDELRLVVWLNRFQSPSLRGSGRFDRTFAAHRVGGVTFQSPSLRGSGRFLVRPWASGAPQRVSIPFIAGQWSLLPPSCAGGASAGEFQSPSLRGSGRFLVLGGPRLHVQVRFQSPSLRGSGRFDIAVEFCVFLHMVSIPFIAGQWSLLF